MQLKLPKLNTSSSAFLRSCGYTEISNQHKNNEISYVRVLNTGRRYPRFHIYINESPTGATLNLHLDAKASVYEGVTAHSGEYDGAVVEGEMAYIKKNSERFLITSPTLIGFQKKSNIWQKIKSLFKGGK